MNAAPVRHLGRTVRTGLVPPSAPRVRAVPHLRSVAPTVKLPAPKPAPVDMSEGAAIGMWDNDVLGNCGIAGICNGNAIDAKIEGRVPDFTVAGARDAYFELTGGVDSGLVLLDVLERARTKGIPLGGLDPFVLAAWVAVPIDDYSTRDSLIDLYGYLYGGIWLPKAAQNEATWEEPADLQGDNAPASWGPHCLLDAGRDADLSRVYITWGMRQRARRGFDGAYMRELYVLLDQKRAEQLNVEWDFLVHCLDAIPPPR